MNRKTIAYTLLEIIVVMSTASIVLGVSGGWIHQSIKASSLIRTRARDHQTLLRLNTELRNDIASGNSLNLKDEDTLEIARDDSLSSYRISQSGIELTVSRDSSVERRDTFELSPFCRCDWGDDDLPNVVALTIRHVQPNPSVDKSESKGSASVKMHLRARVRRNADRYVMEGGKQ